MTNDLTPDGAIALTTLTIAALCLLIYIIVQAIRGKGITVLPDWSVPGSCIVLYRFTHSYNIGLSNKELNDLLNKE